MSTSKFQYQSPIISTELCDTGKVSIICALRVTDKVDITHNFYNFCSYRIDINIDDLTSTIAFAFPYFDTAS